MEGAKNPLLLLIMTKFQTGCQVRCVRKAIFGGEKYESAIVGELYTVVEVDYYDTAAETIRGLTLQGLGTGFSPTRFEVVEQLTNFFD